MLRLFLLVTTLVLSVCSAEAQGRGDATPSPVDFGARRSSSIFRRLLGDESDDYEGIPFDLLELLVSMPFPVQLEMLREFGQEMVDQGEANCNIFGGVASCQALSASSAYHASCPNYPLQVDCAFYEDSMVEIDDDPTWDLRDEATRVGVPMCDGCRDNLEELYCAQAVPKCGTFQTHVELVFLPLLRDVVEAKQKDQDYQPSIDRLLPRVANATGLVAPCKEFCEAVTASCGCGQDLKFKKVIDMLEKAQREHDDDDLPELPEGTFEKIFDAFDDMPLCDMYQPRDARVCRPLSLGGAAPEPRRVRLVPRGLERQQRDADVRGGVPRRRAGHRHARVAHRAGGPAGGRGLLCRRRRRLRV
jgi:hypothetical protein